jgi:hypothetical protein
MPIDLYKGVAAGNPDLVPPFPACLILQSSIFSLGKFGAEYVTDDLFCFTPVFVLGFALEFGEGVGLGLGVGVGVDCEIN